MRVLLTGAAGFIGGAVADLLHERGHEVVAVDALIPQAHAPGTVTPTGLHPVDVRDAEQWGHLLDGVDAVCHQAAMVGAGLEPADLPLYAGHNDLGTAALLAAMHAHGVRRLVLASSMVVYGEGRYRCPMHGRVEPGPRALAALDAGDFENHCPTCADALGWEPVPESAPMDPRSSYAASKVAQEHYTSAWVRQAGGSAVALRYHNVYGPRMPRDTPYSGVAAIFRSALARGDRPRVFEDGGQMRDFVHVADVARANLAALELVASGDAADYEAVNVCSGQPISIAEVAETLARGAAAAPDRATAPVVTAPIVTGEYRLGDVRHIVASPERARSRLGFTAQVGPAEGLVEFADAPLR